MPKPVFLTSSSFDALMYKHEAGIDKFSGKALAVTEKLAVELAGFRPDPEEQVYGARAWGKEHEWSAIRAYSETQMVKVKKSDFVVSKDFDFVGGTIDGLVYPNGGIEVKCPYNPINHMLFKENYLKNYYWQVCGEIWINDLSWVDFVSYDPRFLANSRQRLRVIRAERNDEDIAKIKNRCQAAYQFATGLVLKHFYGGD